jgi:hypothetical protein
LDQSEQQHARKNEPSLEPGDAFSTAAPAGAAPLSAQPVLEAGDMPAWLAKPPAPPTAAQRWKRRAIFLAVSILTVAVAGGATLLGLELYESNASMEVVATQSQAEMAARQAAPAPPVSESTLPFVEKRTANVPPLVLLPQDAAAKKDAAAAAAVAPVQDGQPALVTEVKEATPAAAAPVVAAPVAAVVKAPAPVTAPAKAPVKAPAPVVAAKPASAPSDRIAGPAKPDAKPKLAAAVKKPVPAAKRPVKPVVAKARPAKPVRGTMLQPPRDRFDNDSGYERPARREAIDRRCRPGELARECEARTR